MKIRLCLFFIVSLCVVLPANAHDIGVSVAELIESENNSYRLKVKTGRTTSHLFGTPDLPSHCAFPSNPRGIQSETWKSFEFQCKNSLSAEDNISLPWRRDGIMLTAHWQDSPEIRQLFRHDAGRIDISLIELQAGSGSLMNAAKRYLVLGIEHILFGIDHLLFVLALLIIVSNTWMLVKTVTAFTLAHSITLGLATLGFIHVPSPPVEAAIALSIVFLCVEIIHAQQGRIGLTYRFPWLIAFAFGLLHGLGFAGALATIGLPHNEIPVALLFFNVGVEIGQLLFIGLGLGCLWLLNQSRLHTYSWARAMPVYFIGTLASYWLIERTLSIFGV